MNHLTIKNLTQRFGGIIAISDVNIDIKKGEKVGIIGPNGAGKTTLFNCLTGFYKPTEGSIIYNNKNGDIELTKKRIDKITALGFARTFQNIRLFRDFSLIDNVKIAMDKNIKYSYLDAIFRTNKYYREEEVIANQAFEFLTICKLEDKAYQKASSLSYGDQRRLEIARAIATGAKTIFLDEPAAGMNPQETKDLMEFISDIHKALDLTIVLIEHDMNLVMNVCNRIYVLNYGKLIAEGTPTEIINNQLVIDAYLGSGDES